MGTKLLTKKAYRELVGFNLELSQAIQPRTRFKWKKTLHLLATMQDYLIRPDSWEAWKERKKLLAR